MTGESTHAAATIVRHRHLVLLVAILTMAILQPIAHRFLGGRALFDSSLTVVLFGVVLIVFHSQRDRAIALALAIPTVLCRWAAYASDGEARLTADIAHHLLVAAFLAFAIATILRGIFEERVIRRDHFLGTICGYILAGVAWGNCYTVADLLMSGAFRVTPGIAAQLADVHMRGFYFNYFSLCALTGAGFGDITPIDPVVTTLAWLEAAFGQFYLAAVVSQLVGLKFVRPLASSRQ